MTKHHFKDALTICYKRVDALEILLDAWPPIDTASSPQTEHKDLGDDGDVPQITAPLLVFFHGGGLTVGNRRSWFPIWLWRRFTALGYVLISADYRLIPPSTGHDIVDDIKDLWKFIMSPSFVLEFPGNQETLKRRVTIRKEDVVVAGASAGGLCAYLCATHCKSPPPRALLSIYGMGGNFLTPHYLHEKTTPFFRGRELLDPTQFQEFLYPFTTGDESTVLDKTSGSPLAYHPQTYHIPGYPANPRMLLARLYLQLGHFLDYYTGQHSPSLSNELRESYDPKKAVRVEATALEGVLENLPLLSRHLSLFPQVNITSKDWGPKKVVILHGSADSAVPIEESRNIARLLSQKFGVDSVDLVELHGEEHSFDLVGDADEKFGRYFDKITNLLQRV